MYIYCKCICTCNTYICMYIWIICCRFANYCLFHLSKVNPDFSTKRALANFLLLNYLYFSLIQTIYERYERRLFSAYTIMEYM